MDISQITDRLDRLLTEYAAMRQQSKYDDLSDLEITGRKGKFITQALATIEAISSSDSAYVREAKYKTQTGEYKARSISILVGVLQALREDYNLGYLRTLKELIHADVFSDFLEMANHLMSEGYKDPAAVLAGGVLEEHLRQLCNKSGIAITDGKDFKKADLLNSELAKVTAYSKLDQKNIVAWLDLRNKAAHGRYSDYTLEQVELLIGSIRDFITRVPA